MRQKKNDRTPVLKPFEKDYLRKGARKGRERGVVPNFLEER